MKVKYEEMFPQELEAAITKCPIAYIPCGLLEWHSSHLPLGLDGLKSEELGLRIARKFGGVVLPPIYTGLPGFSAYQGTVTYREQVVHDVFLETFQQLDKIGFKVMIAIGGHYSEPQEHILKATAAEFMESNSPIVRVITDTDFMQGMGIEGDHAGPWETAAALGLCRNLVELENFSPGKQKIKRYKIPKRSDGYDFEYDSADFIIQEDLRETLDISIITKQIETIINRIGRYADEQLQIYNNG